MPSTLATQAIALAGDNYGTRLHCEVINLKGSTTGNTRSAPTTKAVHTIKFQDQDQTKQVLALHVVAVWDKLEIKVVPGPGLFGRSVQFKCGWFHDGMDAPSKVEDLIMMEGYRDHTFGGAANFSEADRTFPAPFGGGRSDVLKMRNFPVGGRTQLAIWYSEADFGKVQVDGDRLTIYINGEYSVFGRN
jgi:hypothetical protein